MNLLEAKRTLKNHGYKLIKEAEHFNKNYTDDLTTNYEIVEFLFKQCDMLDDTETWMSEDSDDYEFDWSGPDHTHVYVTSDDWGRPVVRCIHQDTDMDIRGYGDLYRGVVFDDIGNKRQQNKFRKLITAARDYIN